MTIRKPRKVLLAAAIGAALPVALTFVSGEMYKRWGFGKPDNFIKETSGAVQWMLAILTEVFNPGKRPGNPYLILPIVGGCLLGGVVLWWEFRTKD